MSDNRVPFLTINLQLAARFHYRSPTIPASETVCWHISRHRFTPCAASISARSSRVVVAPVAESLGRDATLHPDASAAAAVRPSRIASTAEDYQALFDAGALKIHGICF